VNRTRREAGDLRIVAPDRSDLRAALWLLRRPPAQTPRFYLLPRFIVYRGPFPLRLCLDQGAPKIANPGTWHWSSGVPIDGPTRGANGAQQCGSGRVAVMHTSRGSSPWYSASPVCFGLETASPHSSLPRRSSITLAQLTRLARLVKHCERERAGKAIQVTITR
jgi:hypothetical protein